MDDYLGSVALPSMKQRQKKLCQVKMKARANPVYNDSTNFGVRMLAKLGWSEGKGLGKREDGMSAPILPKLKQDAEGFGYAGEKDDHWTQHDQDFNQLLKSLNGGEEEDAAQGEDEVDLAKMKSLEEKSKNSRARVHYKKFTRGKDLSRASEKDLANIFGKKSLEEVKSQIVGGGVAEEVEVEEEAEPSEERNILGLTTIKAAVSVQDYFKMKMQEKMGVKVAAAVEEPERKKSKKSKRKQGDEEQAEPEPEPEPEVCQEVEDIPIKKKKRSKNEEPEVEVAQEVEETPKKKSKKDKRRQIEEEAQMEVVEEQISLEPVERKSKKSKRKPSDDNEEVVGEVVEKAASLEQVDDAPKKKSKKKKRKQSEEDDQDSQPVEEEIDVAPTEGKKKKKKKQDEQDDDDDDDEVTCRVKVSVLKQLDEHCFAGSNFADIVGYGLTQDVKLVRREGKTKQTLEKHQFVRQKQTSAHRKRQMLKKVSAFKGI